MKSQGAILSRLRANRFALVACLAVWLCAFLTTDLLHNDAEHLFESGVKTHLCHACQISHHSPLPVVSHDASSLLGPLYARPVEFALNATEVKRDAVLLSLIPRGPPA